MRILVTLVLLYFLTRSDSLQKKLGNGLVENHQSPSSLFSSKISFTLSRGKESIDTCFETYLLCRIYALWEHVSGNCHRRMIESRKF